MQHKPKTGTLFERSMGIPAMSMVNKFGLTKMAMQVLLFKSNEHPIQNSNKI